MIVWSKSSILINLSGTFVGIWYRHADFNFCENGPGYMWENHVTCAFSGFTAIHAFKVITTPQRKWLISPVNTTEVYVNVELTRLLPCVSLYFMQIQFFVAILVSQLHKWKLISWWSFFLNERATEKTHAKLPSINYRQYVRWLNLTNVIHYSWVHEIVGTKMFRGESNVESDYEDRFHDGQTTLGSLKFTSHRLIWGQSRESYDFISRWNLNCVPRWTNKGDHEAHFSSSCCEYIGTVTWLIIIKIIQLYSCQFLLYNFYCDLLGKKVRLKKRRHRTKE